jgi:hypothetical protein
LLQGRLQLAAKVLCRSTRGLEVRTTSSSSSSLQADQQQQQQPAGQLAHSAAAHAHRTGARSHNTACCMFLCRDNSSSQLSWQPCVCVSSSECELDMPVTGMPADCCRIGTGACTHTPTQSASRILQHAGCNTHSAHMCARSAKRRRGCWSAPAAAPSRAAGAGQRTRLQRSCWRAACPAWRPARRRVVCSTLDRARRRQAHTPGPRVAASACDATTRTSAARASC